MNSHLGQIVTLISNLAIPLLRNAGPSPATNAAIAELISPAAPQVDSHRLLRFSTRDSRADQEFVLLITSDPRLAAYQLK